MLRGDLFEVDAGTLCFSAEETNELVRRIRRENAPSAEDIQLLHTITNGWPAALRVLLLSLTHHETPSDYLRHVAFSSRPIAILIGDLLDQLPSEVSDFMTRISLTDRTSPALAGAMTEVRDARERLEYIEAQQLFLAPLEDNGPWYAFHPLFREHLERRLHRRFAAEVPTLHQHAAHWYAKHGLWRNAVRHALAAQDIGLALGWIEQCAMQLVESGDMLTLLSWERQLRQNNVAIPARLQLALAWAHGLAMARDESRRLLEEVESAMTGGPSLAEGNSLRWQCQALRAMLLGLDDATDASGELAQACLHGRQNDGWITNVLLNVLAYSRVRNSRWSELYAMAPFRSPTRDNYRYMIALAYHRWILAAAEKAQGRLGAAHAHLKDAAALVTERLDDRWIAHATPSSSTVIHALSSCMLAEVTYLQYRLLDAAQHINDHLPVVRIAGTVEFLAAGCVVSARLSALNGDPHRSGQLLVDAEVLAQQQRWPRLAAIVLLERVRLALEQGNNTEASACAARLHGVADAPDVEPQMRHELASLWALAASWLALKNGAAGEALALLEAPLRDARDLGLRVKAGTLEALMALAHECAGQEDAAASEMLRASDDLSVGNALRAVLDIPVCKAETARLVERCRPLAAGPSAGFLDGLWRALRIALRSEEGAEDAAPLAIDTHSAALLRQLTSRERQVVRLVAAGGSNKEIGRTLQVSPDTVKYHLKVIFAKLGVDSRTEIAVLASQLGMAPPR